MTLLSAQDLVLGLMLRARSIPPEQTVQRTWATGTVIRLLQGAGIATTTGVPYPSPASGLTLDILGTARTALFAIDLVTETGDGDILGALQSAMKQLAQYPGENVRRWAVGIGYSRDAQRQFDTYAANDQAVCGLETASGVAALVVPVPRGHLPPDPPAPPDPPGPPPTPTDKEASPMTGMPTQGIIAWNPTSTAGGLGLAADVVRDFGASGSRATTKGDIFAGSCTVVLTVPLDFVNGQGIVVQGAGLGGAPLVTTILGGAGTRYLTLAEAAHTSVRQADIRHDDSWAWQAAIDSASPPGVITCPPGSSMNLAAPLRLRSGVVITFPHSTLHWIGPDRGSVFTAGEFPLEESGILGGEVNPGEAACVVDLNGPRYSAFELVVRDGTPELTVMRWASSDPSRQEKAVPVSGNVVRRIVAGTCGTLLELKGQESAPVSANTFSSLLGRDCRVAGVICPDGYVDTNVFIQTDLTLKADGGVGIGLGENDLTPGIHNLIFTSLSVRNPAGKGCTGICLHGSAQVQVLAYDCPGFDVATPVHCGRSAAYYIRSAASAPKLSVEDTTKGWSVTPLQIGPLGTPIALHFSNVQPIGALTITKAGAEPPQILFLKGVQPGDTVLATPTGPVPPGVAWNASVLSNDTVQLSLVTTLPDPGVVLTPAKWRFDVWRHPAEDW